MSAVDARATKITVSLLARLVPAAALTIVVLASAASAFTIRNVLFAMRDAGAAGRAAVAGGLAETNFFLLIKALPGNHFGLRRRHCCGGPTVAGNKNKLTVVFVFSDCNRLRLSRAADGLDRRIDHNQSLNRAQRNRAVCVYGQPANDWCDDCRAVFDSFTGRRGTVAAFQ